ncbi:MAG TPA: hypothetical protein VD866_29180, partial [Urbifossiella sp.]|nr:hypothetical protein [Urbifossiella sp.]
LAADPSGARLAALRSALVGVGWDAAYHPNPDGTLDLYLLAKTAVTLPAAAPTVKMPLPGLCADGAGGARRTRVELRYQAVTLGTQVVPLAGTRTAQLSVLNRVGQAHIPLHAGFVGPGEILNDGLTTNQLLLRVTNTDPQASIAFNPGAAGSRLVLSFDVQGDGQQADWAAGTVSQIRAMSPTVTAPPGGWTVKPSVEGQTPVWTLTPTAAVALAPGAAVAVTLDGLLTSLPAGQANLYVRYENVPGYWDGQLVAQLTKSPVVVTADNRVVVGKLAVGDAAKHEWISVDAGGRVGLNWATPAARLHVGGGGIRVEDEIQGGGAIVLHPGVANPALGYVQITSSSGEVMRVDAANGLVTMCGSVVTADARGFATVGTPMQGKVYTVEEQGFGARLTIHATDGHLQLRREPTDLAGGYAPGYVFLELFQDGDGDPTQNVVHPSIRFHHRKVFWHRIEAQQNGFHLFSGDPTREDYVDIHAANGNFQKLNGTQLTGIVKLFRVPHPARPGHDLVHACLEGPESAVYYRGRARLRGGRAEVRLPEYFEALTRPDGRTVTLTAVGCEPYLLSYEDVVGGGFRVYGTKPDGEFSWEVKAVRADVAALAVEVPTAGGDGR